MFSRIIKSVWRLSAQNAGAQNYLICGFANAVYLKNQGSTDGSSMTHQSAASLEKANAGFEIFRPSKRFNSFISPLLGPFRNHVRVPFFWQTKTVIGCVCLRIHPLTVDGGSHV